MASTGLCSYSPIHLVRLPQYHVTDPDLLGALPSHRSSWPKDGTGRARLTTQVWLPTVMPASDVGGLCRRSNVLHRLASSSSDGDGCYGLPSLCPEAAPWRHVSGSATSRSWLPLLLLVRLPHPVTDLVVYGASPLGWTSYPATPFVLTFTPHPLPGWYGVKVSPPAFYQ